MNISYFNRYGVLAFALIIALATDSVGSPTSDEFTRCHGIASMKLRECLDTMPGYTEAAQDTCWASARNMQVQCYISVREQYVFDKKKRDYLRELEQKKRREIQENMNPAR